MSASHNGLIWTDTYMFIQLLAEVPLEHLTALVGDRRVPHWLRGLNFRDALHVPGTLLRTFHSGHLLGVIKIGSEAHRSFLALRHVIDPRGRAILVEGGVYAPTRAFVQKILAVLHDGPSAVRIDVSEMEVRPMTFLMNYTALLGTGENLASIVGGGEEQIGRRLFHKDEDRAHWRDIYTKELLNRLRERRREFEAQLDSLPRFAL